VARVLVVLLCCAPAVARADDDAPTQLRVRGEATDPEPLLELDPTLAPQLAGIHTMEQRERADYDVAGFRLHIASTAWANDDRAAPGAYHLDVPARGWRVGGGLVRDVGPFQLELGGWVNHVSSPFGTGTYVETGIQLIKRWKLARWMTAFIALGVGRRTWLGDEPPAGERNDTALMLRIGTTFR
jgi:hypothetical protein